MGPRVEEVWAPRLSLCRPVKLSLSCHYRCYHLKLRKLWVSVSARPCFLAFRELLGNARTPGRKRIRWRAKRPRRRAERPLSRAVASARREHASDVQKPRGVTCQSSTVKKFFTTKQSFGVWLRTLSFFSCLLWWAWGRRVYETSKTPRTSLVSLVFSTFLPYLFYYPYMSCIHSITFRKGSTVSDLSLPDMSSSSFRAPLVIARMGAGTASTTRGGKL